MIVGVIEGFYGTPWTWRERRETADLLVEWGADWYVWAPKSEPRHRDRWRDPFEPSEVAGFSDLRRSGIRVSIGLTPGADATVDDVVAKLAAVEGGADGFTLCFDDLEEHDAGTRHARIANGVASAFGRPVWVVPTHYAGTATSPYLGALLDDLAPEIEVMWTGETVVCDSILAAHADARARTCSGRRPLLWDNTPVNDAMMRDLLHLGPYAGREESLRGRISGVLVNPMEFALASRPTLRSAVAWARGRDHVAEWRDEVERLGLGLLAEATSFPGDPHWPGDAPPLPWWEAVRDMPDPVDDRLSGWVASARAGAAVAVELLGLEDRTAEPSSAAPLVGAALGWRAWRNGSGPCTLGRGPRVRPVFSQDGSGRFSARPGVATDAASLVDLVARRVLGDDH